MEVPPKHEYLSHKRRDVTSHETVTSAAIILTNKNLT
jgi:hypothetical protein